MIKVDFNYVQKENLVDFEKYQDVIKEIDASIKNKTGLGSDFLGWNDWPLDYDKDEVKRIKAKANEFIKKYDVLGKLFRK